MGKQKTNIEFIAKDSRRRATFKQRKENIFKKASELSTLCDVRTCVIIDNPYEQRYGYEVLPSEQEAIELLHGFNGMPSKRRSAKTTNPEEMMQQQTRKAQEQLIKLELENRELELEILMHEYMAGARAMNEISPEEAEGILWVAEKQIRVVQARIDMLSSKADNAENSTAQPFVQEAPAIAVHCKKENVKKIQESGGSC
ncbi:Agamous-like MADS-box protein AGL80 [Rhynchospora pubera]|uniref:Agamous-like MADS-box protein AGL80 n=1 Tax=Rhynchospora pubera TaxID=906938 RepID=A0AAV8C1V1_9POAL|nr:Agamous-like MADS-box protein AGL80 [Rhynchospora pubera]KAJ4798475.1 Agamous-like MADS-box protein AGL80 [Rhynchospora pubera]